MPQRDELLCPARPPERVPRACVQNSESSHALRLTTREAPERVIAESEFRWTRGREPRGCCGSSWHRVGGSRVSVDLKYLWLSGDVSENIDHRRPLKGTMVPSAPLVDVQSPVGATVLKTKCRSRAIVRAVRLRRAQAAFENAPGRYASKDVSAHIGD
ncbi:hypothetical protein VTO73DRAFT_15092 [Trametes versicolor]